MAIIKCKMCGGDIELSPDKTFGTCDSCGSTMTFPKVDDEQRAAAFNRGNYFRRIGEFDKALAVYERIVQEDETDAEAHWCCALCRYGIEYVEDPATYEWIPTCHRASFDSILKDVDYLAALEHSDGVTRRQYQRDAAKIAEVQRGILATSQNEEPFDVFLCYKETDAEGNRTRDSLIAQDIYYQLTQQGRRVFFARITLEDKAGAQYEPYIFAALHSAKVMIVVGTSAENFSAVWVKNEWSRFLALMRKDRSKLLLPCYRDMDPYDLPEQLAVLQSYDMSKIGFLQDLLHGVAKVLDADKKPEPIHERVIVQSEGNSNVTALLKRGEMAIEDGDWTAAEEFYDRVLDMDAECAEAYVGKFLISVQQKTLEDYVLDYIEKMCEKEEAAQLEPVKSDEVHIDTIVQRYAIHHFLEEKEIREQYEPPRHCPSTVNYWKTRAAEGKKFIDKNRNLQRARSFAKGNFREALESELTQCEQQFDACVEQAQLLEHEDMEKIRAEYAAALKTADNSVVKLYQDASNRRENAYVTLCRKQEEAKTSKEFEDLVDGFTTLESYKDSYVRADFCRMHMEKARESEQIAREREKREHEKLRKKQQKKLLKNILVFVVILSISVTLYIVFHDPIIDFIQLSKAKQKALDGDYAGAEEMLREIGGEDSENQIHEMYYSLAEREEQRGEEQLAAILFGKASGIKDAKERSFAIWNDILNRNSTISARSDGYVIRYLDGVVGSFGDWGDDSGRGSINGWEDIVSVAAGNFHTVGLVSDGTVLSTRVTEKYDEGQDEVSDWNDIVEVDAGFAHTVGLKKDGTVVATGSNSLRTDAENNVIGIREGHIEQEMESSQSKTDEYRDIVSIDAGAYHNAGLKMDGTVMANGLNISGQCDVEDWENIVSVSAGFMHTVGLKMDGTVVATGRNTSGECDVSEWRDIVAISAGTDYTIGLKADGTVVATGRNDYGQCNIGEWSDIMEISAGLVYTLGVDKDGNRYTAGFIGSE